MNRNYLPILVSIGIVAGLFLFMRHKPNPPPADTPPPQTPQPKKLEPVKTVTQLSQKKTDALKPPERREPSDIVTYEIKDGFGVIQNDIIIGTPEENADAKGLYKMPIPQYWDKPEIPYAIDPEVPRPDEIQRAIKHIEEKTGVKFIPYDNQPDGILFQKGKEHCLSPLGRLGGLQPIRLTEECGWPEITHEIMHTLGFIHEQSRSDRDEFVEILWENVEEKYIPQFEILSEQFLGPVKDTPFDYRSIMIYEKHFFGKSKGLVTMRSRSRQDIRPSRGLSAVDIDRVRRVFRLD